MISRPQGDLVHTGHVGADGAFFGDVAFLDGKYNQLPKQIVAPYRAQDDQNHNHNGCPPPPPHKESTGYGAGGSGSGARHKWALNERKLNLKNASNSGDSSHEYHEISDEEDFAPLESPPFEVRVNRVLDIADVYHCFWSKRLDPRLRAITCGGSVPRIGFNKTGTQ
jgi:hypothetical protein